MRYLNELDLRKIGERLWRQLDNFAFESDLYPGVFVSPKGTVTNLASIPRIAWRIYPPVGNYDEAAVIHDAAVHGKLVTPTGERIHTIKSVADNLFYEALRCETFRKSKVGPKTAAIMYFMVKNFGNY